MLYDRPVVGAGQHHRDACFGDTSTSGPHATHIGGVAPETRPLMSSHGPALRTAVVAQLNTYHHPVGTCRMGKAADEMAVIDATGRVYGVSGSSVVDASIFPFIPSANTNVPTLMAAEHLAPRVSGVS